MNLLPLLVLVGPTAVGKTRISIKLAERLNGEIISGDSMQVYKKLNIGTAKIKPEETNGIHHHLIDIKEPTENFSVAEFQKLADEKIAAITFNNKLPIIVGGTGLYINSVIYSYNFTPARETDKLRKELWEKANKQGVKELIAELSKVDPHSAKKIHPNDTKRIIRALEVYYTTGKPISSYNNRLLPKYKLAIIGLTMDREKLYERINFRVEKMLKEGWLEEVKGIINSGVSKDAPALQGLGYKQLVMYLHGEISFDLAVELIKRDTRRFAKRQLTWFNRDDNIYWIDVDKKQENQIIEEILLFVSRRLN